MSTGEGTKRAKNVAGAVLEHGRGNDMRQKRNLRRAGDVPATGDVHTSGDYTVTPTNIHLESSFKVPKADFERELLSMREQHPDSLVWNRSIESLKREWAAHNAFHALGIARKQTAHADLNWPQPWPIRLAYYLIGLAVWPFIK